MGRGARLLKVTKCEVRVTMEAVGTIGQGTDEGQKRDQGGYSETFPKKESTKRNMKQIDLP